MVTYYLPPEPPEGTGTQLFGVVRSDGAWIPPDEANRDWMEYQAWLQQEGNEPTPWPEDGPVFDSGTPEGGTISGNP